MAQLFPLIEPYATGLLDVGDGQQVYWEASGNPDGKAAVWVHGGPGSGGKRGSRKMFDPEIYRVVQFDQRGCGESRPHASDPSVSLEHNTTAHLIADMERLREHLGIEKWLLYGGSWGSTLALAYAEKYPERVTEIILVSITTTRPEETDWLYHGVKVLIPGPWETFRDALPEADRDGNLVAAYDRLVNDPATDHAARIELVRQWCAWEDSVIAHESMGNPGQFSSKPDDALMAFVRICSRYYARNAWLEKDQILRDVHRLAGIPGVLVHGRLDLSCPLSTAWELAKAWPDAELKVIDGSGHTGGPGMAEAILDAAERFGKSSRR